MVGSQDTDTLSEGLFVQGDGFVEPASGAIGFGEVVA